MQDSITIADVGSMVKVSGNRIATPFGPPSPGSTPTKMPRTSPTIINSSVFQVSRTAKPCSSRPKASMHYLSWFQTARDVALVTQDRLKRSFRHDDVERKIEGDEHRGREDQSCQQRLPKRDATDHSHEPGNQQETRDVKAQKLRRQAE